jgi:alanine racemase
VSESTASRVVNDKPGVNDATRDRVRRVVEELGYELQGLRLRSSAGLVGLIVPELENPIFPAFAQTIETGLARRGFTSVLCTATQDGVQEPGYIDLLLERGVAGIVIVSGLNANTEADHDIYRRLLARNMPMVFLNGFVQGIDATFVSSDDRYAGALAVRHLLSLGHRRIGFITGPNRYLPVQRKLAGVRDSLRAELGDGDGPFVAESLFAVEGGHAAAVELLEEGCTALICASDLMALGAVRTVVELGRSVPEDVSVIGYDDTPLMAFVDPPLTTIAQPVRAMSDAAVRTLLERIGGAPPRRREYLFRPELVVRGSTGPVQLAVGRV